MIPQLGGGLVFHGRDIITPLPSFFPPISKKWITLPKFEYILNIFDPICGRGPDIPPTHTHKHTIPFPCL